MAKLDQKFKNIIFLILTEGTLTSNRTNTKSITFPGVIIRHDMSDGFPLLTLRKIPFKSAFVELEGFLKGITSKKWYKDRGCNFWNEWCSPQALEDYNIKHNTNYIYGNPESYKIMSEIDDLGPIYGYQWSKNNINQLDYIIDNLKNNKTSRRMVCNAWNPNDLDKMALPPCHFAWQVNVTNNKLNLFYHQRSCDFILGNNLVGYGLLLKLLAKESNLDEGMLVATYNDCHIYENHVDGARELLKRNDYIRSPNVTIKNYTSLNEWSHDDCIVSDYYPITPNIKFPVAI